MRHLAKRIGLALTLWLTPLASNAQTAIPEYRFVATSDMDFFGSDLDALFDTDLESCRRACVARADCAGFTFNSRSNACFPKSQVSRRTPYEGAISAIKTANDPVLVARAETRLDQLPSLTDQDITAAATLARDLGLRHRAGGVEADMALRAAADRSAAGDAAQALGFTGAALSLTDRADLWTDYAGLALTLAAGSQADAAALSARALSAAINGFLRAGQPADQAAALVVLSRALERAGRGRDMIAALRLAQTLAPDERIAAALVNAIGKYGFRVTDSTVESDAAAPRICAQFSAPLARTGVDYESFVRLTETGLAVQADGSQLCVDGIEHGQRYRLTLRAGLPSADGETLASDVELTHYVRDRSPALRFPGRTYVLPRTAEAAVPIETVNLSNVDLRLRRVSDRNLLRAVQDGFFGRPLTQWQDQTFASDIAQEVWTGSAGVGNDLNRDMTTRLPLAEALAGQPAGIYALTARVPGADPYDDPGATQWFVLSDLGLSTLSGGDGLLVNVRSLSDARPRQGVTVTLISRANAVLASAVSDAAGDVRFDPGLTRGPGGAAPALVLAQEGEANIGFLSLTDPAFDLSDRGVEGRAPAGPVDVFMTTDRGAYRAGETIHVTALARDPEVTAIDGLPLVAVLHRPDGVEYARVVSGGGVAGGHVFALPVGPDVPRGTWRIDLSADPDAPALASATVLVEDFLPERIEFDLALPDGALGIGDTPSLSIDARYLFGAPGADLSVEGQVTLRGADTVEGWPGYRFGRHDMPGEPVGNQFGGERTDAAGLARLPLDLPEPSTSGQPLELTVTVRLADGSARPVERQISAPVQPATPVIGIKPLFDEVVTEGTEAQFEVIALAPDLTSTSMPVRWTLNRVETRYQWYQLFGNWAWEPTTRRTRVATGEALLDGPMTLSQPVDWGQHELVVERVGDDYAAASVGFSAGWYAPADSTATPDRLEVSLDKDSYAPGDTARLRIEARDPGLLQISVLSDRVIERNSLAIEPGETVIPLSVTADWGIGAYVTATLIRPMDRAAGRNPTRALGLAHAAVEPVGKRLQVEIDVPQVAEPRQTQRARLTVVGASEGEEVWLTLAAVDLGILNLTGFQPPDPSEHYFGQRRLGVELRDVYGRLIDGMNGALGTVRSGGDGGAAMRMQSPPPTQDLMAAFSGPVRVGPGGEAAVDIPLPAFNGTVRLMAVAWSRRAIGQTHVDMQVRDPVVVTASLPNFLAPGDQSRIRLDLIHADGPAGDMTVALTANGDTVEIGEAPGVIRLEQGGRARLDLPVTALAVGDARLSLVLTTPDGRALRQGFTLPVRANDPAVARTQRITLDPGRVFTFSPDVFAGLRPGTGKAILSAGPMARFDVPGLLATLDRYPYGCTEQVASQALPLLYLSSVAEATGLGQEPALRARVDASITRILTNQTGNGAFGLWQAQAGDFWLDAYITDFLARARAAGHDVPDRAFGLALDNLRNRINYASDFDSGGEDIAYALMVLAREGAAAMGDLRYYADVKGNAFATPLAAAQLGAALALYGDQQRADAMFARAARLVTDQAELEPIWRADYGTPLRDAAGLLALATEAGSQVIDVDALGARLAAAGGRLSTQEAAWSLLAARALIETPGASGLLLDGVPVDGPFLQVLDQGRDAPVRAISPAGDGGAEITLTTLGVPLASPAAGGTGYAITRSYYSMEGEEIAPDTLTVGDRMVVVLQVTPFQDTGARLMIDDPMPAGIEIDNPNLLRAGDIRGLGWLPPSEASHAEFRSDRFLAAVDSSGAAPVNLAYIARAVTPGSFHHPAASVEDMYRPRFRARTGTGRMDIAE
jgi:uncharacterized protein YfaS (alpha-2-macroglobulin family)